MKFRVKECCFNDICKYQIQYKNPKKKTIFNFWKYEEWLPYVENDYIDLSFPTSTTRRGRVTKGKSPCLMESNNNLYSYKDGIVRTVNQVEMERLQGFPDGYTSILSKAKAGSLLGDGWTLPIIEHIFSFIK